MTRGRKIGGKNFYSSIISFSKKFYVHSYYSKKYCHCFFTWLWYDFYYLVYCSFGSPVLVICSVARGWECLLCVKRDRLTVAVSRLQQNLTGFLALPGVKTRTGLLLMVSLFFLEVLNAHVKSLLPSLWILELLVVLLSSFSLSSLSLSWIFQFRILQSIAFQYIFL